MSTEAAVATPAPQVEATAVTPEPAPVPAPPWGSADEFNPEKAWKLIQDLRAQKNDPAAAKELSELRGKVETFENEKRTDVEKAQAAADKVRKENETLAGELARARAAVKYGLGEDDLAALDGIPADRVDALAERLATKAPVTPKAPSAEGQGKTGDPIGGPQQLSRSDLADMSPDAILAAQAEGRLDVLLGIKTKTT